MSLEAVAASESHRPLLYDKSGEEHYNVVSAFIKSMRGSDPDAAVYWMMRMLAAGDDPLFVSRRMLIFASEDVGKADPQALVVASAADATLRRVGMPEGHYALAQACIYLATAPKSNACNAAWHRAKELIEKDGALPVPKKLRNAVTPLMREEGYGSGYRYAHDFEGGVVPGETYLPDELEGTILYEPSDRGAEAAIRERLAASAARESRAAKRYASRAPARALSSSEAAWASPFLLRGLDARGEPGARVFRAAHRLEHLSTHQVHRDVVRGARTEGLEGRQRLVEAAEGPVFHRQAVPDEGVFVSAGGHLQQETRGACCSKARRSH